VTATPTTHIFIDEQGKAWVDDTNVKVIEIVLDHVAYGWNADTIHEHHPNLSLAQVYAALAWYYDHQKDLDSEIDRQGARIRELRTAAAPSALHDRVSRGAR
jgi:uncharacterized protein (DUF433 family)